ncbi:MAG: glycosyltransferase family 2 protein [Acidimicrobiales bacterium]
MTRTIGVIPALDEAGNIAAVVAETLAHLHAVVVVDNGSTDDTAAVAADAGAIVVDEPRRGYGFACAAGSAEALRSGADIVVYIDGDGSSVPAEATLLIEPITSGAADLVLGSRTLGQIEPGAMPAHQRLGNTLSAWLMRLLYRIEVTDLGPFRAIKAEVLRDLDMSEMTFGWPTEMTVKCAKQKATIVEVPVTWKRRGQGRSKVSGTVKGSILAARYILGVTLRHAR